MRRYSLNSLVSLSSGVQPPHWAPPKSLDEYRDKNHSKCSHLTSESRKAQGRSCRRSPVVSLYANKSGVCVCRRRRWSIILPEVYHVLKLTRRSAKSDLGVFATCAKPALTSPRAEESRVAKINPRHSKFFRTSVRTSLTTMGLRRVSQATKEGLHLPRHFSAGVGVAPQHKKIPPSSVPHGPPSSRQHNCVSALTSTALVLRVNFVKRRDAVCPRA